MVRIKDALLLDMTWWRDYLKHFNGIKVKIQHIDVYSVLIDACILASGAFYNGDFSYVSWQEDYPKVCGLPLNLSGSFHGSIRSD